MKEQKNTILQEGVIRIKTFVRGKLTAFGYLPRWIVFCMDCVNALVSVVITYLIIQNLTPYQHGVVSVLKSYGIIFVVQVFCFILFRTYAGIIRHSSILDAFKLMSATFTALVGLIAINYVSFHTIGIKLFLIPTLIIQFIILFVLLFAFRIGVKLFYENIVFNSDSKGLLRIMIYGADANAFALAAAIKVETPKRFNLVGFIDQKRNGARKEVLGMPIVQKKDKISAILRSYNAKGLIIADTSLTKGQKLQLVDDCLAKDIKVLTLPKVTDWSDQKKIVKQVKKFDIKDLLERLPILLDNDNIASQIEGKTLLVTGAAGSIGAEIVQQVFEFNPQCLVLVDQADTPLHHLSVELSKIETSTEIVSLVGDIKDKVLLQFVFQRYQPNVVYHTAAYKHVPLMEENPYQAIVTNVLGTKNLADIALANKVDRFVMVSTDKAVNPSNVMGASKRIAELYVQSLFRAAEKKSLATTKFITTRFGNVLGSNGSVVPLFTKQIENGGPLTITHPDIIRYFMTIPEACQLVLEAGAMGAGGEVFVFDMGKPVKILDLAHKMIRMAGFIPEKDIAITITGLRPGEKLYEELLNDSAKTLPTHHEKIMCATDAEPMELEILECFIRDLREKTLEMDIETAVAIMKQIVPEFKSLNSIYGQLDLPEDSEDQNINLTKII